MQGAWSEGIEYLGQRFLRRVNHTHIPLSAPLPGPSPGRLAKPPFKKTGHDPTDPRETLGLEELGMSRLFFDTLDHKILEGFIPAQEGIHPGFGKIPRPEATKSIP